MQNRGLVPSVVDDTIRRGAQTAGRDGTIVYITEQAKVVLNAALDIIVTVMPK
jgi:hypothetical protein